MNKNILKLKKFYGYDIGVKPFKIEQTLHKKIDLHYEFQENTKTKEKVIRLDCDIAPYNDYRCKKKKEYFDKVKENNPIDADIILFLRDELQKFYLEKNNTNDIKYRYRKRKNYNYNWLVKYEFNNIEGAELIAEIDEFIEKTKPQLLERIEILKKSINKG